MYKATHNSSLIQQRDKTTTDFASSLFGNASFRLGMVLEAFDVEDDKNVSKLGPEYTVMTVEQDKQNGQNTSIYKNVIAMDGFGGVADFFQFTHRKAKKPKEAKKKGSLKNEVASIVGILCLDSNSEKAVIIGSFGNPSKGVVLSKESGHNMEGEFNGINWKVDKEGALTVTFKSATEDDGTPQDKEAGGTAWKIEKDGSIELTDGATEKIRIDKTTKKIDIESEDDISITSSKKNVNIIAKESINLTATQDLIAMAEGKAAFTVNKTFDIEAKGAASMKAQSFMFESKSMINMKAQSLISIKAMSSLILQAPQVVIGKGTSPALKSLETVTLGTGFAGVPVISTVIAGYSTEVLIS